MNLDIVAIRARASAATPGPWTEAGDPKKDSADVMDAQGFSVFGAWSVHADDTGQNLTAEDRAFIASARSDVPALCDEVESLRAEREHLRELAKKVRDYWRANPGRTRDGISTPGMLLLMAVEK